MKLRNHNYSYDTLISLKFICFLIIIVNFLVIITTIRVSGVKPKLSIMYDYDFLKIAQFKYKHLLLLEKNTACEVYIETLIK